MSIFSDIGDAYNTVTSMFSGGTGANVTPSTTTITRNEDGSQDITHKTSVPANQQPIGYMPAVNYGLAPNVPVAPPGLAAQAPAPLPTSTTPSLAAQAPAPLPTSTTPSLAAQAPAPLPTSTTPSLAAQGGSPVSPQTAQQLFQGQPVPPSMSGQPQTPGAGMFPQGAQPIPAQPQGQNPQLTAAIQQNETGGMANPNAAVGAAGETGAMQVLPSTLKNPGFGVKPAADNSPEEANRVGRDYYNAMYDRYQDPLQAAGAYKAGPGAMDRAILRAQTEGGNPLQYLPASTQSYVAKFAQNIGHRPGQTREENPALARPWENPAQGLRMPGDEHGRHADLVNEAGTDVAKLNRIMADPSTPPGVMRAAATKLNDVLNTQRGMDEAQQKFEKAMNGDPKEASDMQRALTSDKGSYLKAFAHWAFGDRAGFTKELGKLMGEKTIDSQFLGNEAYTLVKDPEGVITNAYDSSGKSANQKTIAALQAQAVQGTAKAATLPSVHGSPVINSQGETGLMMYDPRSRQTYVQVGSERRPTAGWTTMAQNPELVQNKAAAQAVGAFTGQGAGARTAAPAAPTSGAGIANAPAAGANVAGSGYQSGGMSLPEMKTQAAVSRKEQTDFVKDRAQIGNDAQAGQTIVDVKKAQAQQLYSNPEIMGLFTGSGAGSDALRNILLYGTDEQRAHLGQEMVKYGVKDPRTIEALNNYGAQQGRINGALVRQNLPGIQRITQNEFNYAKGSVLSDVSTSTPMAIFQNNSREQFIGDLTRAKNDFVDAHQIKSNNQLQSTWPKEQDMLYKQYAFIDDARNKWIRDKIGNQAPPTNSDDPAYRRYVDTVLQSFKVYPTPEYDLQNHSWNFGTAQADKAARQARMKSVLGQ